MIPTSQFIKDGSTSRYWKNIQCKRQHWTYIDTSTTKIINRIENKKIEYFDIESMDYVYNQDKFEPELINNTKNEYYVEYIQYVTIEPTSYGIELKYLTTSTIELIDVLNDTGGAFKWIGSVVMTLLILYIYGFEFKFTCFGYCKQKCQWCKVKYNGYAPYQQLNRQQRKQLYHFLKSNGYYSWDQIKHKFDKMEAMQQRITDLEAKLIQ